MIIYNGNKTKGKVFYLLFKNEDNVEVEIPVEKRTFEQLMQYFERLQPPKPEPVERGNEEE